MFLNRKQYFSAGFQYSWLMDDDSPIGILKHSES